MQSSWIVSIVKMLSSKEISTSTDPGAKRPNQQDTYFKNNSGTVTGKGEDR